MVRSMMQMLSLGVLVALQLRWSWASYPRASVEEDFKSPRYADTGLVKRMELPPSCKADQDVVIDDEFPKCRAVCAVPGASCYSGPRRKKREAHYTQRDDLYDSFVNQHDESGHHLSKRAFRGMTLRQIANYLPNQLAKEDHDQDPYYPVNEGLYDDDWSDATVIIRKEFSLTALSKGQDERIPFSIGAAGLHGCTVVTVVSDRAVWMGHFWEQPGWLSPSIFEQRVLRWLSGSKAPVGDPGNVKLDDKPDLFPRDTTRAYIMTPRRERAHEGLPPHKNPNFHTKVLQLKDGIRHALGNQDVPIVMFNYVALDHKEDHPDWAQIDKNQRGMALFQFDPEGNGRDHNRRKGGWRLFYEHHLFRDTDPRPGAESADGIPDR